MRPSPESHFVPPLEIGRKEVEQRETLFKAIVVNKLYDTITESMQEADVPDEAIQDFMNKVKNFPEDEILAILAIPFELQGKLFPRLSKSLHENTTTIDKFIESLRGNSMKNGHCIGFHVSKRDIQPIETVGPNGETYFRWEILGTEQDHRDDDLTRAYYSFDYQYLYRHKAAFYMYLVRAETGPKSTHKQDNDGSWGRASALSVITSLDLQKVDDQIEQKLEEMKKAAE